MTRIPGMTVLQSRTNKTLTLFGSALHESTFVEGSPDFRNQEDPKYWVRGTALGRRSGVIQFPSLALVPARHLIKSVKFQVGVYAVYDNVITVNVSRVKDANSGFTQAATWNFANGADVRWAGDAASDGGTDAGCSVEDTDYFAPPMATQAFPNNQVANEVFLLNLDLDQFHAWRQQAFHALLVWTTDDAQIDFHSAEGFPELGPALIVEHR